MTLYKGSVVPAGSAAAARDSRACAWLVLAAVFFVIGMRSYDADAATLSDVQLDVAPALCGNLSTGTAV